MTIPDRVELVLQIISKQLAALSSFDSQLEMRLPIWRERTISLLAGHVFEGELQVLSNICNLGPSAYAEDKIEYAKFLADLKKNIQTAPDYYLVPPKPAPKPGAEPQITSSPAKSDRATVSFSESDRRRVFVVHGHDTIAKLEVTRFLEQIGLVAVVLHEQPNEGRTIIEKFERNAETVEFAVVVLTPDDSGYPANKPDDRRPRARQNVVLELGYFCGALGRHRVCVLHKGDIEIPSDYLGVVYTPIDVAGAWKLSLAKELRQAGFIVDMNRIT